MKNSNTLELILEKVCEYFNLSIEDVKSKRKYGNLPYARQIYFFIARKMTDSKLEWIGRIVNKDHSCVIFSIKKIESQKEVYTDVKNDVISIYNSIVFKSIVIQDVDLLMMLK